jgi:hypothetical protein
VGDRRAELIRPVDQLTIAGLVSQARTARMLTGLFMLMGLAGGVGAVFLIGEWVPIDESWAWAPLVVVGGLSTGLAFAWQRRAIGRFGEVLELDAATTRAIISVALWHGGMGRREAPPPDDVAAAVKAWAETH